MGGRGVNLYLSRKFGGGILENLSNLLRDLFVIFSSHSLIGVEEVKSNLN